ncbi:uncharacterized protein LOC129740359 [Uranotaenia lowii]|uniref:uncharacterized protein LOC129740359 n=1 Tax=Uranotaenia lowii TaxID=190385 RepID=UPI00247904EE|nr:uncharacterized protein LOC129740359 [Uranotaenia lowii]
MLGLSSPNYHRVASDGVALILHFLYLFSSRDEHLADSVNSYQLVLDKLGHKPAKIYAHLQFVASIVANHYMSLCAADIILEYLVVMYQLPDLEALSAKWRRWVALGSNCLLTMLNCYNPHWTTITFAVYAKSLFMSFWMTKIWYNFDQIRTILERNSLSAITLLLAMVILITVLVATKECHCFFRM